MDVVPNGWEDAPAGFTITIECIEGRKKRYFPVDPDQMHELTGLPTSGWAPHRQK